VAGLEDFSPDIVHAQWTYEFAHAALQSGFPTLVTARDSPRQILRHMPSSYRVFRAVYGRYVLSRCQHLSTLSPYMRDELAKAYRCNPPPTVIPNGIDSSLFFERPSREPGRRFTFTCVAGWDRRKNPKPLLKAFNELKRDEPAARLLLVGAGFAEGGQAAQWLARHGGTAQIEFRGSQSHAEVLRILREETDAFIHPTREESFGMAIVEAMASQLPVIAGERSGAVPWLLDFGAAGVLCDIDSPRAIASSMKTVLHDPVAASNYGKAALKRAKDMFSLDRVCSEYLFELSRIISGNAVNAGSPA
jgi:glycosyltransferase involved in cell wall biosynthesis